jgi:anti-sigma-K factor RskA
MEEFDQDQAFIRQYLLGGLDSEAQEQFEKRILTDADFKAKVLFVEGELIEDYAADALPESERKDFADQFMSLPQQRRRVEVTRALFKYAAQHDFEPEPELSVTVSAPDRPPLTSSTDAGEVVPARKWFIPSTNFLRFTAYGCGGVIVIVLLFGGWKYIQRQRQQTAIARELELLNSAPTSVNNVGPLSLSTFQLSLEPYRATRAGVDSGGRDEPPQVVVTSGIELVQFRLALLNIEAQSFRAVLRMDASGQSFPINNLRPERIGRETIIFIKVPARLLDGGNGQIKLYRRTADGQVEWVDDYNFQVIRP